MQFVQRVKQDGSLSKLTFHAHTALCRTPSVSVASLRRAQGARWFFHAAAGGCKRDDRLAGQVMALKEGIDRRRRNIPPDRETHKIVS